MIEIVLGPHFQSDHLQKVYLHLLEILVEVEILEVAYQYCSTEGQIIKLCLTVIVTVGTVIGCSAKTKFCQMAPKSTENH